MFVSNQVCYIFTAFALPPCCRVFRTWEEVKHSIYDRCLQTIPENGRCRFQSSRTIWCLLCPPSEATNAGVLGCHLGRDFCKKIGMEYGDRASTNKSRERQNKLSSRGLSNEMEGPSPSSDDSRVPMSLNAPYWSSRLVSCIIKIPPRRQGLPYDVTAVFGHPSRRWKTRCRGRDQSAPPLEMRSHRERNNPRR